ncbi:hypothetical protein [Parachryseolinea silvisoli]|uniref:hypothetical protein n=1 Tax=Parachryseolinea silvisoli TaxID=2873601 RepID=UPI002265F329|nr:hypothetical protein [Parachryseolinea silvisoli]MCD9017507.1 hypothetical protein [Parachryseolinea silvisoli]
MPSRDAKSPAVGKAADRQTPLYLIEEVLKTSRRMQLLKKDRPRSSRSKEYAVFVENNEALQKRFNKFFDETIDILKVPHEGMDWFIMTLCEYGQKVNDDLSNSRRLAAQFYQAFEVVRKDWPTLRTSKSSREKSKSAGYGERC